MTLMLDYAGRETISVKVDEKIVDLNTTYNFTPNTETGFNMAFGFYEASPPPDFGRWRVRLVNRYFNSKTNRTEEKVGTEFPIKNCKEEEFGKENLLKFKNLKCSDVFEQPLYGDYFTNDFSFVEIDYILCNQTDPQ
jgi:hypothetical protein